MNVKKAVLALGLLFLGFWMFTDPQGLAGAARASGAQAWELTVQLFTAVIRFVGALT